MAKRLSRRRALKRHNRKIAAEPIKAALTDKRARAVVQKLFADGKASKKQVTDVESTLRQSRRVNADYNANHVHIGLEPREHYVGVPAPEAPEPGLTKIDPKTEQRARRNARREQKASAHEADMRRDTQQAKTAAAEGDTTAYSANEIMPNVGRHFKHTERAAAGAAAAALERENQLNKTAWPYFERADHGAAGLILAVSERAGVELIFRENAFARAAASYLKKATRPGEGRSRRQGEIAEAWQSWLKFREQWRRDHPQTIPLPGVLGMDNWAVTSIPEAVRAEIYRTEEAGRWEPSSGPERRPVLAVPRPAPDPLVAAWEALRPCSMFRFKSLDEILKEIAGDWLLGATEGNELRERYERKQAERIARREYGAWYEKFRPRNLLD